MTVENLDMYSAVGDCEHHWIIADSQEQAMEFLGKWLREQCSSDAEFQETYDKQEWCWTTFEPNDVLTIFEDQDDDGVEVAVKKTAAEWIQEHGRAGHFSCGEIG